MVRADGPRGESVKKKLSPDQVSLIRDYLDKKVPTEKIQVKMGVTRQQVAAVKAHMTMKTYGRSAKTDSRSNDGSKSK